MPASFMGGLHPGSGWSPNIPMLALGGIIRDGGAAGVCRLPRHSRAAGALLWALTPLDEIVVSWIQPQGQAGMTQPVAQHGGFSRVPGAR